MADLYRDSNAGIGERVADLLGRMTLEEKVAQLGAIWLTSLVRDESFDEDAVAENGTKEGATPSTAEEKLAAA